MTGTAGASFVAIGFAPPRTGITFVPREPPEGVALHALCGVRSLAWAHQARIRLHCSAQTIVECVPTEAGLLHLVDEDSCILKTGSDSLEDLLPHLPSLTIGFTVLDPPELRTLLRVLADRYSAAAVEPPQDSPTRPPAIAPP